MKSKIVTMTALGLIMATGAAQAAQDAGATTSSTSPTVGQRIDNGIEASKNALDRAGDRISNLMSEPDSKGVYAGIDLKGYSTAENLIGKDVNNLSSKKVATVEDILVDQQGVATKVILSNGGLMGIGDKLVALDYKLLHQDAANGDMLAPLTDEIIKQMTPFSYTSADAREGLMVKPAGTYSIKQLLAGNVVDAANKNVASIDDVTFSNGEAKDIIATYGTTLGMGGHKFAVDFDSVAKLDSDDSVNVRFNDALTQRFGTYIKSVD